MVRCKSSRTWLPELRSEAVVRRFRNLQLGHAIGWIIRRSQGTTLTPAHTLQREMGGWGRPLKSLWSSHPAAPPLGPPAPRGENKIHYTPALAAAKLNLLRVLTHSFFGCSAIIGRRPLLCFNSAATPCAVPRPPARQSCPPRTRSGRRRHGHGD
jgi:hypothetical protein